MIHELVPSHIRVLQHALWIISLGPLGKITSYIHFPDFTQANLNPTYCLSCSPVLKEVCKWNYFQSSHILCTDSAHQNSTHCPQLQSRPAGTLPSPNVGTVLHRHFVFVHHLELLDLRRQTPSVVFYTAFSTMIKVPLALIQHAYSILYDNFREM